MTREELIALAAPPCHVCGGPVRRVEQSWVMDAAGAGTAGAWTPGAWWLVCGDGHRVRVERVPSC